MRTDIAILPNSVDERAALCCRAAARYEERGEYEAAAELLGPFWAGPHELPCAAGLSTRSQALLFLRAGSIAGWLGGRRRTRGSQEFSRDLLSRSAELATEVQDLTTWGETQKHLAISYWREGAFDEARIVLTEAVARAADTTELYVNLGMVERCAGRYEAALGVYSEIASAVEVSTSAYLRGIFHNGVGLTWKALDRVDEAFIEMTAAAHHFRECGNKRYELAVKINLANLCAKGKEFEVAHSHLDDAERLAMALRDSVHLAQAKDSRALVFLDEGRYADAELCAQQSVKLLEEGEEYSLLVDSLVTHARALSRCDHKLESLDTYARANSIATERLGQQRSSLVAIEMAAYLAAEATLSGQTTLTDMMKLFEHSMVKAVLDDCGGNTSRAAQRLGVKQQTLSYILSTRHKDIRPDYSVGRPRKKSKRADVCEVTRKQ